ncbi:hypothetical protein MFLAVUS_009705 [Mucor flavus]|uniref:Uncharacterized protein n=1 Tax=Mucor flavus TaxID=439312 RepID=A0ABP9ZAV1_9FUNG
MYNKYLISHKESVKPILLVLLWLDSYSDWNRGCLNSYIAWNKAGAGNVFMTFGITKFHPAIDLKLERLWLQIIPAVMDQSSSISWSGT